jgi:hypothetical protein
MYCFLSYKSNINRYLINVSSTIIIYILFNYKMNNLSYQWKDASVKYKLLKQIGKGRYGEVIMAKHRESG